jgi:hypothetical protein
MSRRQQKMLCKRSEVDEARETARMSALTYTQVRFSKGEAGKQKVTEQKINFLARGPDTEALRVKKNGKILPAVIAEYTKHMRHVDR